MSTDTHLAFAHPEERAKATSVDPLLDRISLRDHIVSVEIGAFQVERDITQRLSFNIVVEVRHAAKELDDDVDLILSYDRVTEAIDIELAAERLNLLETLAERIADRILREPQAQRVFVRIEKLDRGGGALGVEIVRSLEDTQGDGAVTEEAEVKPRVVFLSDAAVKSNFLLSWIDQLSQMDAPLVFCVPARVDTAASASTEHARARIALLAMEQNAWALAALDARCLVIATRTELDWAMKQGKLSIWAPSKFVLDAVNGPLGLVSEPIALAAWFAKEIGACELLVIGGDLPSDIKLPSRAVDVACESI